MKIAILNDTHCGIRNSSEIFILTILTTFLLLDFDFKILDEYIRPGGSDSLTYEYFSRLVLEGNFLEGGEGIYTYSPGTRYFLFFLHIAFGERLKYIFILFFTFPLNFKAIY